MIFDAKVKKQTYWEPEELKPAQCMDATVEA